jgi:hypothetical protein
MGRLLMVLLRSKGKEVEKGAFVFWILDFFSVAFGEGVLLFFVVFVARPDTTRYHSTCLTLWCLFFRLVDFFGGGQLYVRKIEV